MSIISISALFLVLIFFLHVNDAIDSADAGSGDLSNDFVRDVKFFDGDFYSIYLDFRKF